MLWTALILGVVEGLTEFLPISSTGHLILAGHLLGLEGKRAEVFEVFIQLGAILAVVWEYRATLLSVASGLARRAESRRFVVHLLWAFLPAALLGLLLHPFLSDHLFRPRVVAGALVAGALAILAVEARPRRIRTRDALETTRGQAILIGMAQCLALWPGFSRSAATILGGLLVGLDRRAATEFSFFLAIPTLLSATLYDLAVHHSWLLPGDAVWLGISFAVSFLVALVTIRWLLRFLAHHDFRPFAWYRLALGALVLLVEVWRWRS